MSPPRPWLCWAVGKQPESRGDPDQTHTHPTEGRPAARAGSLDSNFSFRLLPACSLPPKLAPVPGGGVLLLSESSGPRLSQPSSNPPPGFCLVAGAAPTLISRRKRPTSPPLTNLTRGPSGQKSEQVPKKKKKRHEISQVL